MLHPLGKTARRSFVYPFWQDPRATAVCMQVCLQQVHRTEAGRVKCCNQAIALIEGF